MLPTSFAIKECWTRRELYRRDLRDGQGRGRRALADEAWKGMKIMAIVDRHALPLMIANHHEVRRLIASTFILSKPNPRPLLATAPMIVIHSMMTYAKTASRWSRRTAPIARARRKMDADFGDMPGAGWSNGSSPGFNGSAASLSAGSSSEELPWLRATRLPRHPLQTILR